MTARYERVRADGKTLILRDPTEVTLLGVQALSGVEVNREGEECGQGAGADERRHIIELALVTRRTPLVWNNHYAMLEEAH